MNKAFLIAIAICLSLQAFGQRNIINPYRFGGAPVVPPTFVRSATNVIGIGSSITITGFSVTGANAYGLALINENSSIITRTVTGVTWNGAAMTLLANTNFSAHGNCYIFGISNPTTGDIIATFSGSVNSGANITGFLFNGSAGPGAAAADFSAAARTSVSLTVGSVATDLIVDFLAGTTSWTPGAGQTVQSTSAGGAASASSIMNGAAGTTAPSWSGTSTVISQLAVAIHGM